VYDLAKSLLGDGIFNSDGMQMKFALLPRFAHHRIRSLQAKCGSSYNYEMHLRFTVLMFLIDFTEA